MSTGIGKRIKDRRIDLNMSQEELAHRLGLRSKSTICKVEKGDDNLTSDTIKKYASALDTTIGYLMGWDELEVFDISDKFERKWNALGGGRHPINLSDTEYSIIINFRASDPVTQSNILKLLNIEKNDADVLHA